MNEKCIREVFEQNEGIFRLAPVFIPRRFSKAGRRLRLHPHDYYALGTARGSIKERWFSSVIAPMNGPLAPADEGLSYVSYGKTTAERFLLRDAVDCLGAALIGTKLMDAYGTWPMYSKFFDYAEPLFHHLHLSFEAAARVGKLGKPEAYYYPPQYNNYAGTNPSTYFGFSPEVTKDEVKARLAAYEAGDNRITELSRAYRIELGTGWYTPPGVVHAPGSYLTYEPQWNSDVNSVYENIAGAEVYPYEFLAENCPPDKQRDLDYILSLMDWEKNVDPDYRKNHFRPPVLESEAEGVYRQNWIVYDTSYIGAQELTVFPGQSAVIRNPGAYGIVVTQGTGIIGGYRCQAAGMLRFGQLSQDEYFVGIEAAQAGVRITNDSEFEPLVMLKHFGPDQLRENL